MQICRANAAHSVARVRLRTAINMGPTHPTMDITSKGYLTRKPKRLTLTISDKTFNQLIERSVCEGRSMSNLGAFLLETALHEFETRETPCTHSNHRPWSSETRLA